MSKERRYYVMARYQIPTGVEGLYSGYHGIHILDELSIEGVKNSIRRYLQQTGAVVLDDTRDNIKVFIINMIKLED